MRLSRRRRLHTETRPSFSVSGEEQDSEDSTPRCLPEKKQEASQRSPKSTRTPAECCQVHEAKKGRHFRRLHSMPPKRRMAINTDETAAAFPASLTPVLNVQEPKKRRVQGSNTPQRRGNPSGNRPSLQLLPNPPSVLRLKNAGRGHEDALAESPTSKASTAPSLSP